MNRRMVLLTMALLGSTTACFRIHYVNTGVAPQGSPSYEHWHHNVIDGLAEVSPAVNLRDACPQGWAEVYNRVTFLNWLAGTTVQLGADLATRAVTRDPNSNPPKPGYNFPVGIWSPSTVSVTCAQGPSYAPASVPPTAPEPTPPS